jgi:hypothetical protein
MNRSLSAIATALLAFAAGVAGAASTLVPAHPTALQPVDLRMAVDSCAFVPSSVHVAASGATIRITQQLNACLVAGTPRNYDVRLGAFPAGDYRVEIYGAPTASGAPVEALSFSVTPRVEVAVFPPPAHPLTDYTGLWWDPSRPGFGLALHQNPLSDSLFGAWYVYDGFGAATWFTLQGGQWTSATRWSGRIFRTSLDASGAVVTVELGGTAEIDFTELPREGGSARFTFALPANGGTWSIVRFPI